MKGIQDEVNYARIAEAIRFIRDNRKEQPGLKTIAEAREYESVSFPADF